MNGRLRQEGASVDSGSEVVDSFTWTSAIQGVVSQLDMQIHLMRVVQNRRLRMNIGFSA
jgi:hypothetical protein